MSDQAKQDAEIGTTGHEWDGIEELNNPLPRWWLWIFYATIAFSLIYVIIYPAIPLVNGATKGLWGYTTRGAVEEDIAEFAEANRPLDDKLVATDLTEIRKDPELARYATAGGAAVFRTFCAQCHGAGGGGAPGGYPSLVDDAWLWGGDMENIYLTIAHGVRSEEDDDTRYSEMPVFAEILEEQEIAQVVEYVLNISGQDHDAAMAEAGAVIYEEQCAACHGEQGEGVRELGAPTLNDAIWLYGGDRETIIETVTYSRYGMMPAWIDRLSEAELRQVTTYVHQFGGGE